MDLLSAVWSASLSAAVILSVQLAVDVLRYRLATPSDRSIRRVALQATSLAVAFTSLIPSVITLLHLTRVITLWGVGAAFPELDQYVY